MEGGVEDDVSNASICKLQFEKLQGLLASNRDMRECTLAMMRMF